MRITLQPTRHGSERCSSRAAEDQFAQHIISVMAAAAARSVLQHSRPHRLVTIRFSNYNEQARWVLDYFHVPYEESGWLPFLATFGVIANGGLFSGKADKQSSRLSTPFLVTDDGLKLHDSVDIMRWTNKRYASAADDLYPNEEAGQLQAYFIDRLGPLCRRLCYFYVLEDAETFLDACEKNCGPTQTMLLRWLWPWAKPFLVKRLGVTPEKAEKARINILKVWKDSNTNQS